MLGTDLFQAYEQTSPNNPMMNSPHPPMSDASENVDHNHNHNVEVEQVQQMAKPINTNQESYFTSEPSLQEQLQQLQIELNNQKKQKKQDNIVDKYISKKKDVLKLFLMALTILLAFSMHYLIIDLIKNYSLTNDLSSGRELFVKLAYPISVLMVIWTIKVINIK